MHVIEKIGIMRDAIMEAEFLLKMESELNAALVGDDPLTKMLRLRLEDFKDANVKAVAAMRGEERDKHK
jgi:hypothetical protein